MRDYFFPPLLLPFFIIFILMPFFFLVFIFATSQIFQLVFNLSYDEAVTVFFLIVVGSLINIPLYEKEGSVVVRRYSFFGVIYSMRERRRITVAVNVGGCVIPSILAVKLLIEFPFMLWFPVFIISSLVIYMYARPVQGIGIAVPTFVPPIIATLMAYLSITSSGYPIQLLPKLAFSTGVLSALFGADILHLKDLSKIGGGVMSIGGAGTFDGIFLTGVFAVVFSVFLI
jgi:uncharacterized membrane protein